MNYLFLMMIQEIRVYLILALTFVSLLVLVWHSWKKKRGQDLTAGDSRQRGRRNNTAQFDHKASAKLHSGFTFSSFALSDTGRIRNNNEDNYLVIGSDDGKALFCAVADGMGGQQYGEVASEIAVKTFKEELGKGLEGDVEWAKWLQQAALKANADILKKSVQMAKNGAIGSTLVAAMVHNDKAYLINVGDSRAYLFRDGQLHKLTKDHSLVSVMAENKLIEPDEIYTHPRRNEIMRFLGQSKNLQVDLYDLSLEQGDTLLLCSDGLWGMLRDSGIEKIMIQGLDLETTCKSLVGAANLAGGDDNITVILAGVGNTTIS